PSKACRAMSTRRELMNCGRFATYWKSNKQPFKAVTINYSQINLYFLQKKTLAIARYGFSNDNNHQQPEPL
ncbi:MAG: hypothetical protein ABJ079_07705, partial [Marinomonas sp.]